jgi:hypothetical protein
VSRVFPVLILIVIGIIFCKQFSIENLKLKIYRLSDNLMMTKPSHKPVIFLAFAQDRMAGIWQKNDALTGAIKIFNRAKALDPSLDLGPKAEAQKLAAAGRSQK